MSPANHPCDAQWQYNRSCFQFSPLQNTCTLAPLQPFLRRCRVYGHIRWYRTGGKIADSMASAPGFQQKFIPVRIGTPQLKIAMHHTVVKFRPFEQMQHQPYCRSHRSPPAKFLCRFKELFFLNEIPESFQHSLSFLCQFRNVQYYLHRLQVLKVQE
jgi:hypothetical protein